MTGGDIAGLIAAGVFAILVALLAVPILRLTKVFEELIEGESDIAHLEEARQARLRRDRELGEDFFN